MATITSNQSGNWAATSTWVGGSVPAADDLVVIAHGHKVTLNTNIQSTRTGDVTIDGNLHFASGGKMHLHGRMTVKNTSNSNNTAGEFVEGTSTSGSLLSMVGGTEIKISGSNSDQHGIQTDSRRWCGVDIQGGEPTLKTELNGAHDYEATYLTVDSATNFTTNDLISVYLREVDFRLTPDECFWVHDVDTDNNRVYIRQYVHPLSNKSNKPPVISSVNGSTITVDDAAVFRVGYKLIFGFGNNRNVLTVTGINKRTNVITFGSSVDNDPSLIGEYVYQTGTEKYHLDDSHVRRLASAMTANYSGAAGLRTVDVNNVSDFSVGDTIYIEACGDNSYTYVSGSETNAWRHNLVYTISSISNNTITVDRDILYDGSVGGLVSRMTRDIVIKACDSSGNDVAIGDQDTARVFFNVKYWTSTTWNQTPTKRCKIKYVEFNGLGYNTGDSTNFRAGVTIAGYLGRYDTKITGSSHTESTIHNSSGVSQTGENYVDGCSYTAYNLVSNSTTDGDSYPSICIRNPYGIVSRNNIIIGSGRGMWHWSSQYHVKSHGHIAAVANYTSTEWGAAYEQPCEYSYMYLRMAEDYGINYSHVGRQNDMTTVQHINVQYQNGYAINHGYASNATWRRIYCDKYRYMHVNDSVTSTVKYDSRIFPNYWDASSRLYGLSHTPNYDGNGPIRMYCSGNNRPYRSTCADIGKVYYIEHGFREDGYFEYGGGMHLLNIPGEPFNEIFCSQFPGQLTERLWVPANATVRLRSTVKVNSTRYDGTADTVDSLSLPVLVARPRRNSGLGGRHSEGVVTDNPTSVSTLQTAWDFIGNADDRQGVKNSTEAQGKLHHGFLEYVEHTSSSQGAWETKELVVAPQKTGYELTYGYYVDNSDMEDVGFKAMPLQCLMDKPGVLKSQHFHRGTFSKLSIRSNFNTNKKRISGRI